jgi:hypothetical protein
MNELLVGDANNGKDLILSIVVVESFSYRPKIRSLSSSCTLPPRHVAINPTAHVATAKVSDTTSRYFICGTVPQNHHEWQVLQDRYWPHLAVISIPQPFHLIIQGAQILKHPAQYGARYRSAIKTNASPQLIAAQNRVPGTPQQTNNLELVPIRAARRIALTTPLTLATWDMTYGRTLYRDRLPPFQLLFSSLALTDRKE